MSINDVFLDLSHSSQGGTAPTTSPTSVPFWGTFPDAWDRVVIRRKELPGVCEVRGKGFTQRIDKKHSPGRNGHTPTHLGIECAEIEIILQLWTEAHLTTFAELIPLLKPRKKTSKEVDRYQLADDATAKQFAGLAKTHQGVSSFKSLRQSLQKKQKVTVNDGGPEPVPIYHPALALFKIRSVIIESCSVPEKEHGTDKYLVHLKCSEFMSGAARNGAVSTKKKSFDLTDLGPGAIAKKLAKPTPADDNTGP